MKVIKTETIEINVNAPAEEVDREIATAIQRASSYIHKTTMMSGGHFVIFEGLIPCSYPKRHAVNGVLNCRWQIVCIEKGGLRPCVTVVKRGDFLKAEYKRATANRKEKKLSDGTPVAEETGLSIPEITLTPTKNRQPDLAYEIYVKELKP